MLGFPPEQPSSECSGISGLYYAVTRSNGTALIFSGSKPTSMWLSKNPTGNIYQEMTFTLEHTSWNFILGKYIPLNSVSTPGCTKPSWIIKQVY